MSGVLVYKWFGTMSGFLQSQCVSPLPSSSKLIGLVAFLPLSNTSRPFSRKIMFSRIIIAFFLLAALANGMAIKRE